MLFIDIVRRSGKSLLSAKARTILTAFAIAVGTFALTLTLGASNGAQNYANSIIRNNFDPSELIVSADPSIFNGPGGNNEPQVYDSSFGSILAPSGASRQIKMLNQGDLDKLRSLKGVSSVTPGISLSLQYITRDGFKKYVATMQAYDSYKKPDLLAGNIPSTLPNNGIILPEGFLNVLGFDNAQAAIGKTIRVAVQKQIDRSNLLTSLAEGKKPTINTADSSETTLKVVAVTAKPSSLVQPGSELYLYSNENTVTKLNDFATKGSTSYRKYLTAYVKVQDGTDTTKLDAVQADIKKEGYGAQSVLDTEKTLNQIIKVLQGIVSVFGLIAIVASVFGIINTMYISVLQRTREIGLMKALGMHKKDIRKLFRYEAALIGFIGGLLGSILALVLGILLNPWISDKLSLGSIHLLDFKLGQIAILVIALVVVAIIAGFLPARKAAKLDPIEALRTE